ncbi:MAG: hypothetical protein R3314_02405 [Longimicrobiales bacterium]|nr:hypothetical protein [Longimicrobiales bacterium]
MTEDRENDRPTAGMQAGPASAPVRGPGAPAVGERPLGVSLLTWLYWFWAGATVLLFLGLVFGEGPVPIAGETVPRSEAIARVLPVLLPMGLAVIGAALALSLRQSWARPAVLLPVALAVFGPALSGVGTSLGDILAGAVGLLAVLAGLVWYLYFTERATAYFAELKADDDSDARPGPRPGAGE